MGGVGKSTDSITRHRQLRCEEMMIERAWLFPATVFTVYRQHRNVRNNRGSKGDPVRCC